MCILRNYTLRLRDSSYSEIDEESIFNAQKMNALKWIKGHCSLFMLPARKQNMFSGVSRTMKYEHWPEME